MEIRLKLERKLEQKLELKLEQELGRLLERKQGRVLERKQKPIPGLLLEQELGRLLERKQGRVPDQRIALLQDPILLTGAIPDQRIALLQDPILLTGAMPDQRIALLQDPILLTGAIPDQRTEAKQVLMYPLEQILARTTELNQEQIVVQNREPIIPTAMLPILRCIQKMEPVIIPRAIAIPAHQSSPKMRGGILRSPSRSSKPSRPSSHHEPHNTRSL